MVRLIHHQHRRSPSRFGQKLLPEILFDLSQRLAYDGQAVRHTFPATARAERHLPECFGESPLVDPLQGPGNRLRHRVVAQPPSLVANGIVVNVLPGVGPCSQETLPELVTPFMCTLFTDR